MTDEPWIALISPTLWDREQLGRLGGPTRWWRLRGYGSDAEGDPATFDAMAFVERAVEELGRRSVVGVTSSSDYPGCLVAAVIAYRLGLPGPQLASLLAASHKYYSRLAQQRWVPEATPEFWLVTTRRAADLRFPVFVKPVKSWFSQFARQVNSHADLLDYLANPHLQTHLSEFVRPFNQLLARFDFEVDASQLIAEEVLRGHQVTLEGYVLDSDITVLSIVDTFLYAGTPSFERFSLPSIVDPSTAQRMAGITRRIVRGLGLTHCLFNIEYIVDPSTGDIHIVEINPRMCGQFADLNEAVFGVNTYEVLACLAAGTVPPAPTSAQGFAASYALRSFSDGIVLQVPDPTELERLRRDGRLSLFVDYYAVGERLSTNRKQDDGWSYRFAVANIAGTDHTDVAHKLATLRAAAPTLIESC